MSNNVKIIDNLSENVLFETTLEKIHEAYSFAATLEEQGLDIRIESPGITESLVRSLGATESELAEYKQSLVEEIDGHNDDFGCSLCPSTKHDQK